MKTADRKCAAEQGISEDEAVEQGMEAKSKEAVEEGGGLREGVNEKQADPKQLPKGPAGVDLAPESPN